MNQRWSLDSLYTSFQSPEFKRDLERVDVEIQNMIVWAEKNLRDTQDPVKKIEEYITMKNSFLDLYSRLYDFAHLTVSVDARNEEALRYNEILDKKITSLTGPDVCFQKWLSTLQNIEGIVSSSKLLEGHRYHIMETLNKNKYLLSEKEEVLLSKMKNTGSRSWAKLQGLLSSTLLVDITLDGVEKHLPLPVVRNMAYDSDPKKRKAAYEAELKSYKKIEESSAACLNGIKGEVLTVSEMRGYNSPLHKTLEDSRMDQETLDAMLSAIKESLPAFHKYFRKKAELLGHKSGLPFYDLFAPVGTMDAEYSYEEAREFIVKNFKTFSSKLANFADNAFEKRWIDAEPREGKRGGAFCSNLHSIGESRILANFNNSFDNVITLAHELGHGYHGDCLKNESAINSDYPMPIAETASIFCETIVKNAALKQAAADEAFSILEGDISDAGQVIVDIYSRFLFESELFRLRAESSLSVNQLKEAMLKAQKEAYGDGLDPEYLHPYMWVNKPHYYYADANFYNFPYAFGLLFGKGVYAEYIKRGPSFTADYDRLLNVTGKMNIADVASTMGINVHSIDFWRSSLNLIKKDIEKFISLK